MKKIIFLINVFISFFAFSQLNPKDYKTVFFQDVIMETEDYKIFLVKSFAREEILKFKIRIFNKTNDLLYVKPESFVFTVHGKSSNGNGRPFTIQANGDEARYVDVNISKTDMRCEKFQVALNGIFKIPQGDAFPTADGELPTKRGKEVKAGQVSCELIDCQMGKVKSFAKYTCEYTGDKIAVLDPCKCVAIMPKGQENQCSIKKDAYVLDKGDKETITVEFMKLNGAGDLTDGITLKWKDSFRQAVPQNLKSNTVELSMDPAKSEK